MIKTDTFVLATPLRKRTYHPDVPVLSLLTLRFIALYHRRNGPFRLLYPSSLSPVLGQCEPWQEIGRQKEGRSQGISSLPPPQSWVASLAVTVYSPWLLVRPKWFHSGLW